MRAFNVVFCFTALISAFSIALQLCSAFLGPGLVSTAALIVYCYALKANKSAPAKSILSTLAVLLVSALGFEIYAWITFALNEPAFNPVPEISSLQNFVKNEDQSASATQLPKMNLNSLSEQAKAHIPSFTMFLNTSTIGNGQQTTASLNTEEPVLGTFFTIRPQQNSVKSLFDDSEFFQTDDVPVSRSSLKQLILTSFSKANPELRFILETEFPIKELRSLLHHLPAKQRTQRSTWLSKYLTLLTTPHDAPRQNDLPLLAGAIFATSTPEFDTLERALSDSAIRDSFSQNDIEFLKAVILEATQINQNIEPAISAESRKQDLQKLVASFDEVLKPARASVWPSYNGDLNRFTAATVKISTIAHSLWLALIFAHSYKVTSAPSTLVP